MVRWQTVPCNWTGIAEAAFTELDSGSSFDAVSCCRPQVSATTVGYCLYTVDEVLRCSASMDQMH